ncbi:MAG: S41 family peptidase [Rhodospirillales bacterium]
MIIQRLASAAAAAAFTAAALCAAPSSAAEAAEDAVQNDAETYRLLNLFGDVFERVRSEYVERPSDKELIESAITGMLTSLDPHSAFMNAEIFKEMQVQTRGEFGGLGIEVTMDKGVIKVVSPIDDTPAYRAGIQAGDLVSHLDGEAVLGMTLSDAVDRMRGRIGSDIRLTVLRGEEDPFDVTITRDSIQIQSVRSRLEDDIFYIRITSFSEQSESGVRRAMDKLRGELGGDPQGIVLDLRNNPGGLLDQAVKVTDAFLGKGEIVSTRSRDLDGAQRFNAREGDLASGTPMVVLINGGSASASEIVAGALRDHRRAIVMGVKSFGKGSVQTIIPLGSQGAMRLTTARYYTPSGVSIQATGIEPDIIVEQARVEAIERPKQRREEDLRGALEAEDPDETAGPASETAAAPERPADYQLQRALDLLRGVALFQGGQIHQGG